jgi:phosphoribosyl 1,2-cyclic phosphate phosphodiesterase
MSLKVTILGCGSSGGVPRIGGDWGACDPHNPRNRRTRCSLLVERFGPNGRTQVLVDTSPDLREQLLSARVHTLDGVLYTHDHADHTHGIDDLRAIAYQRRDQVDVYMDAATRASLEGRFAYCFHQKKGSGYQPILRAHTIAHGTPVIINGAGGPIEALPFDQLHGNIMSLGFRFAGLAYSSDLHALPEQSLPLLGGLDVWIVDALRRTRHPCHFTVEQALEAVEQVGPRRAILTHMHGDLDFEALRASLPAGVEPAFDGMIIECAA